MLAVDLLQTRAKPCLLHLQAGCGDVSRLKEGASKQAGDAPGCGQIPFQRTQVIIASDLDARMLALEAKCIELAGHNTELHTKVLDLEARSRRHKIKIVGIQEGEEEGRPTKYFSRLIPKPLGVKHFPHSVKVDQAHSSLLPKPTIGAIPHTILTRIHHFQEKELILRLGRQQSMEYKILIFPDYTSEVMAQHCAFREGLQALHDRGKKKHTLCGTWPSFMFTPKRGSTQDFRRPKGGSEVPGME